MAVVLATFMLYVGIKGGDVQEPVLQASELSAKRELAHSTTVQIDGIAAGPVKGTPGQRMTFYVTDRDGTNKTKVVYEGTVPDAFRVGRNVIITGKLVTSDTKGTYFQSTPDTLVTKCPSKFEAEGGTTRSGS
jgi:cytochrome c-type biogenesis protein CcmE